MSFDVRDVSKLHTLKQNLYFLFASSRESLYRNCFGVCVCLCFIRLKLNLIKMLLYFECHEAKR